MDKLTCNSVNSVPGYPDAKQACLSALEGWRVTTRLVYALDEPKDDLYTTVLQATPVQEWSTLDQLGAPDNIPFPVLQTLNIYYEGWPPESFLLFFENYVNMFQFLNELLKDACADFTRHLVTWLLNQFCQTWWRSHSKLVVWTIKLNYQNKLLGIWVWTYFRNILYFTLTLHPSWIRHVPLRSYRGDFLNIKNCLL